MRTDGTSSGRSTPAKRARVVLAVAVAAAVSACAPPRETAPAAPAATRGAAEAQQPASPPEPSAAAAPPPAAPADVAEVVVPAGTLYLCVSDSGGTRRSEPIEFAPNVGELCRKHPEMGPCKYHRDACRRGGGRVYAAGGIEITAQTEAEYDSKVMRVRLKSN